jgi:hypothetical protein
MMEVLPRSPSLVFVPRSLGDSLSLLVGRQALREFQLIRLSNTEPTKRDREVPTLRFSFVFHSHSNGKCAQIMLLSVESAMIGMTNFNASQIAMSQRIACAVPMPSGEKSS